MRRRSLVALAGELGWLAGGRTAEDKPAIGRLLKAFQGIVAQTAVGTIPQFDSIGIDPYDPEIMQAEGRTGFVAAGWRNRVTAQDKAPIGGRRDGGSVVSAGAAEGFIP